MKSIISFIIILICLVHSSSAQDKLRVFQFNVWQEGTSVPNGFDQIIDLIIESKADIITLSEVRNYKGKDLHERIIQALAKRKHTFYGKYAGGDVGLISRYPVIKTEAVPSSAKTSIYAYHIELPNKKPLIVCSAHLEYTNYAVYLPRGYDGNSFKPIKLDKSGQPIPVTDIAKLHAMDAASTRDEAIAGFIKYAKSHADTDVILAGDFNEASHLDWTQETAKLFDHNGVVIEWKNSKTLADNGFSDSYREIHPDPVVYPGLTWPSENSGNKVVNWTPKADDRERIDFIYYNKENLVVKAAFIAGSKKYYVKGKLKRTSKSKDDHLLERDDWPSDHKGVIVDFDYK
ncbi:endonuclease [Oceaniferula spumae]|uniref:Endonuclease n=1 Tax=Oceaniferula spumae TaxID=2979115 RepID=A0AAT9FKI9_9BACT